jgi:hypothetical protein
LSIGLQVLPKYAMEHKIDGPEIWQLVPINRFYTKRAEKLRYAIGREPYLQEAPVFRLTDKYSDVCTDAFIAAPGASDVVQMCSTMRV